MGLETATYISDLVATNPALGDPVSAGDDHLRLLKAAIKNSFPNIAGAMTATHSELNFMAGASSNVQDQLDAKSASDHTHTEDDIADGSIFARVGSLENITGAWTFEQHTPFEDGIWAKQGATRYAGVFSAVGAVEPIRLRYQNLDYAAGTTKWLDYFDSSAWLFGTLADDNSVAKVVFQANRTGNAVTNIEYGNTTDLPSHNFRGAAQFNNGIVATAAVIGNVSDAEIQTLDGIASNIQTQLNGKAAASHSHTGYVAEDTGAFTMEMASASSGGTVYTTGTAHYRKLGNEVILSIPNLLFNTTFGSIYLRGLPAQIIPNFGPQRLLVYCFNNSSSQVRFWELGSGGNGYLGNAQGGSDAWTGGSCGIGGRQTVTYRLAQ